MNKLLKGITETIYLDAEANSKAGKIDPIANLYGQPVYIQGCYKDEIVHPINQEL